MQNRGVIRKGLITWCVIALISALMGSVTGCSTNRERTNASSPAVASPQEQVDESPAAPTPGPEFDAEGGPVLGTFNGGGLASLEQVNGSTGEASTVYTYRGPAEAKPSFDLAIPALQLTAWYVDQVFDPGLDLMAVNWAESDGSRHVGWVDQSGALSDVTSAVTGEQSDFAAGPQHVNALFDANGNFRYVDVSAHTLNAVDVRTLKPVGKPVPASDPGFFQPNGDWDTFNLYETGIVKDFLMPARLVITSDYQIAVQDVIDAKRVLVRTPDGLKIMGPANLKKGNRGTFHTEDGESIPSITPATDWTISTAAVSGDGKKAAFEASRGEEHALFVMDIGGGQPKKLVDLSTTQRLLFWR